MDQSFQEKPRPLYTYKSIFSHYGRELPTIFAWNDKVQLDYLHILMPGNTQNHASKLTAKHSKQTYQLLSHLHFKVGIKSKIYGCDFWHE